ncbi:MAG: VOC family protein [Actinobacteria bacterium]|nr:VOC family protein [Actinomycetota bacterium]
MAADVSAAAPTADLLAGDDCLSIRAGRLWLEEVDLTELARRFGTPVYVVSEAQLRANARHYVDAFSWAWPEGEVLVMPSIKANFSLALRRILSEEGTGCDTFGAGELDAALRGGVAPDLISLNGSSKDAELIGRAVRAGVRVTLDSLAELELARAAARAAGVPAKVRLRLRPWLDIPTPTELFDGAEPIAVATQRYKPGIPTEQLLALPTEAIAAPEIDLLGVMAHIGRQGREPAIWAEMAAWVGRLCGELGERWGGWRPREIDLGGGFPMPRDPFGGADRCDEDPRPPVATLEEYAIAVAGGLRRGLAAGGLDPQGIRLEVEPGRSLYGNAGIHLARVRNVKSQSRPVPHTWVETDTSEVFLADVVFERNRWQAIVADRADADPAMVADLVGISCNPDVIVPQARLAAVEAGNLIAFLDTGAYQDANASNFNALPRPGTVLVHGAECELVKRAERTGEAVERDQVPARLGGREVEVLGLDHASVTCADLDRSLGFYAELLGIPVRDRGDADDEEVRTITGLPGAVLRWADLDLGGGRLLELMEYVTPPPGAAPAGFHQAGQGHFSLRVADADAAHAALLRAGVTTLSAPVEIEHGDWRGCRCFYALDPDGMTVELIQRPV